MATTEIQQRLQALAREECLPCLLHLPPFAAYAGRLCVLLVGSVATGLCTERSDVDLAIVCDEDTYAAVSSGTAWDRGRPSAARVAGVQLHYYAVTFGEIERQVRDLDDAWLYLYGTAVVLHDPGDQYRRRVGGTWLQDPDVHRRRLEGKLDLLLRRSRALDECLAERDPVVVGGVCLELVTLCLQVAALLDRRPFDPRKRLFATAIQGPVGQRLRPSIRRLLSSLGALGDLPHAASVTHFAFPAVLRDVVAVLAGEATAQGFREGTGRPPGRPLPAPISSATLRCQ